MKSAYEVASDLAFHCDHTEYSKDICFECVEKGITEFAEERGKEEVNRFILEAMEDDPRLEMAKQKIRNATLDEAAQEVSSYMYEKGLSVSLIDLAEQIRALKK